MRRLAAAAVLVVLAISSVPALAQDYEPGDVRAAAEKALEADGAEAARRALEAYLEPGREMIPARHLEAVSTAFEILAPDEANAVAARLLDAVLTKNRGRRDAWRLSVELIRRIESTLDAATGPAYFRRLTEIYPDQIAYRYYLADLYRDLGRASDARKEYEHILRAAAGEARAVRELATLDERAGDVEGAIDRCDGILETAPNDLETLAQRVWLLSGTPRRFDEALDTARRAIDIIPLQVEPGPERDRWIAHFEAHADRVEQAEKQNVELRQADRRLGRLLWASLAAWAVFLGGGLTFLRRRDWI